MRPIRIFKYFIFKLFIEEQEDGGREEKEEGEETEVLRDLAVFIDFKTQMFPPFLPSSLLPLLPQPK